MKILHREIKNCHECPCRTYDETMMVDYCNIDMTCIIKIRNPHIIHESCPLPDKEQYKNESIKLSDN